jgi:hypothetical protein
MAVCGAKAAKLHMHGSQSCTLFNVFFVLPHQRINLKCAKLPFRVPTLCWKNNLDFAKKAFL